MVEMLTLFSSGALSKLKYVIVMPVYHGLLTDIHNGDFEDKQATLRNLLASRSSPSKKFPKAVHSHGTNYLIGNFLFVHMLMMIGMLAGPRRM